MSSGEAAARARADGPPPRIPAEVFFQQESLFERCPSGPAAAPHVVVDGHNHDGLAMRGGTVDATGMKHLAHLGIGAVDVPLPLERTPTDDLVQRIGGELEALRRASAADVSFDVATDPVALPGVIGSGPVQVVLSIEWFGPIFDGDPDRVRLFRDLGIRMIGLVDTDPDGLFGAGPEAATLTDLGRRIVAAMNHHDVLIDVTHLSHPQKLAVIAHSRAPVVASHSLVQAVTREDFNLPDEVVAALAAHGGSVWVSFNRSDLLGGADEEKALDLLIAHISYLVARLGPDHVGIGTDLQAGGRYVPPVLNQPDVFSRIRGGLAARGFPGAAIDGILGRNVVRILDGSTVRGSTSEAAGRDE